MTPDAERATIRVKAYARRKPDNPLVSLRRLKHAQLAVEIMERDIAKIVRDDIATERVKAERRV